MASSKITVTVEIHTEKIEKLLDELKGLQTYKLSEDDDQILVNLDDVIAVLAHCVETYTEQDGCRKMSDDSISRRTAIDAPEKFIKDCNPDHFVGHQKFIEFMDDAEIGSFGNWQFANGFNLGLTAAEVEIKKLPSAQPEQKKGKWIKGQDVPNRKLYYHLNDALYCSVCHEEAYWDTDYGQQLFAYCPHCGAEMEVEG